jgi:hypothetical protein
MTKKATIVKRALELLSEYPKGLRYSELIKHIQDSNPDIPTSTIGNTIVKDLSAADNITKPVPGFFILTDKQQQPQTIQETVKPKIREEDFYKPFADWIVNELEECTKAIPLGGNIFRDKWGTPDIIGIREPRKSDIVKMPIEIVVAEIKINSNDLITAFGQACSYKLFSHKSYIVIPKSSSEEDIARLDGLSLIFGIGLILFNSSNPELPNFEIRTRAMKLEPDMFYVNKYLKIVEDNLFS